MFLNHSLTRINDSSNIIIPRFFSYSSQDDFSFSFSISPHLSRHWGYRKFTWANRLSFWKAWRQPGRIASFSCLLSLDWSQRRATFPLITFPPHFIFFTLSWHRFLTLCIWDWCWSGWGSEFVAFICPFGSIKTRQCT